MPDVGLGCPPPPCVDALRSHLLAISILKPNSKYYKESLDFWSIEIQHPSQNFKFINIELKCSMNYGPNKTIKKPKKRIVDIDQLTCHLPPLYNCNLQGIPHNTTIPFIPALFVSSFHHGFHLPHGFHGFASSSSTFECHGRWLESSSLPCFRYFAINLCPSVH